MMAFGTQIQHGPYSGSLHTPDCDARDGEGHTHWHACGEGCDANEILLTRQSW
jgi:hypothetical protein